MSLKRPVPEQSPMEGGSAGIRARRRWRLRHLHGFDPSQRTWIHARLVGWTLIGLWQVLSLASEFFPVIQVESKTLRVIGKILGLVGLVLVAVGFERLMHLAAPPKATR